MLTIQIRIDDASMVVVTGIKENDLSSNVTLYANPATTELLVLLNFMATQHLLFIIN